MWLMVDDVLHPPQPLAQSAHSNALVGVTHTEFSTWDCRAKERLDGCRFTRMLLELRPYSSNPLSERRLPVVQAIGL